MFKTSVRRIGFFLILACCLFFAASAFSQTAPFGYLDTASASNGNTTIPCTGTLIVNGWAADYTDFAPVSKVQILIDGKFAVNATLGLSRPDVAAYLGSDAYTPSGYTAAISLANYGAGAHTVTAVAYNSANISGPLTNEKSFTVQAPDLSESNVAMTGTPVAGGTVTVSDTVTNVGQFAAGYSLTRFYVNTSANRGGTLLGSRSVPSLNPAAASTGTATPVVLPKGIAGTFYLVACANDTFTVAADKNGSNNCAASNSFTIAGPDLTETVSAPATGAAGKTIAVVDTLTNSGAGAAGWSLTRFYLNTKASKGGTVIGSRSAAQTLVAGASDGPATTTVTLPAGIAGSYFVLACANDTYTVADVNNTNNCASAPITISGADMAETINSVPATAFSGAKIDVTETTNNLGTGSAGMSITRFFLNTTSARGGTLLGSRSISSIDGGAASGPVTTTFTLPAISSNSLYYVIACANDTNTVVDANGLNNCAAAPVNVYVSSKTVVVDPTRALESYDPATCGTTTATCKSIADGIAKATAGQTVLVYPGTYVEQLTVNKNISLVAAAKNQAIIKAPADAKLTQDSDGTEVMLTITGGVTATVRDMNIAGPIVADSCADNIYGIFVKNANATITGNTIDSIQQSNPALWGCQPGLGIRFGSRAMAYTGHTGTISNNVVTAPAKGGIVVDGDNTNVNVTGNMITGLNVTGIIGQNGIQVSRGATSKIDGNTVSGFRYGDTLANLSAAGILIYEAGLNVSVTNNTVSGNDEGIAVYHSPKYLADGSPDFATQYTTGVTIKKNQASNNVYLGIHIDPFSKGNTIWNNTVLGNSLGWDELDEHPDFTSNDWGSDPSEYNTIGVAHAGLVFTY